MLGTPGYQRRFRQHFCLGFVVALLGGCVWAGEDRRVHDPPLARNIDNLVEGQTTRIDILRMFGEPDVHADGPNATVSDNHPMLRWDTDKPLPDKRFIEEFKQAHPYSSIDDRHEAFFYLETLGRGFVVFPGGGTASSYINKLLIFVDKESGTVDRFYYWEEFPPT